MLARVGEVSATPGQCWTGSDAADYMEKRERRKWTQRKLGGTVKD